MIPAIVKLVRHKRPRSRGEMKTMADISQYNLSGPFPDDKPKTLHDVDSWLENNMTRFNVYMGSRNLNEIKKNHIIKKEGSIILVYSHNYISDYRYPLCQFENIQP